MEIILNEQQVTFLEELLAREFEEDENNPKSATDRAICYQLLKKLQK